MSKNLAIMYRGTEQTFVEARRREVIDLTVCSNRMVERVFNWRVMDRTTMSAHRAIYFDIRCGSKLNEDCKFVRIPRNTGRYKYQEVLQGNLYGRVPRILKSTRNVES